VIRATHRGEAIFIVDVFGYGEETSGSENLFNEIGNFKGETPLDELPAGCRRRLNTHPSAPVENAPPGGRRGWGCPGGC
jgi:hypothetical protein